ncbi:MAG TPA: DNA mismatch repair endonuclease MutL [Enhygromyxa sp.]|nr:DNA mismatch repair endonuclease MutL [Enhygromyxa sp.]
MTGPIDEAARIAVLPAALADQIAAGEVVERPGSIVKELVENAIDAGATRIEIELSEGGRERIRVIDDGRGIHRDDLILAVTRHATSKLREPEQLIEIHTLGFRGEALASIAAVARVEIRSRRAGEPVGHRLAAVPGEPPCIEPIGMPFGTQIEIAHLFANVPARRKFLRAEATEIGHCVDAVIRAALVHPSVGFRIRHDGRELLELRAEGQTERVIAILQRRGGAGPFCKFSGERDGIFVAGWFATPSSATRQRNGGFVVVRRRVVRERTLAAALKQAYGDALPGAAHPVACLFVEPPRGTVDVNVHPQKSEVRFATAQRVYAAVRELIEEGLATAPWRRAADEHDDDEPIATHDHDWAAPGDRQDQARAALAGWSRREGLSSGLVDHAEDRRPGYRLGTRALGRDRAAERQEFRGEVERLRSSLGELSPGPSLRDRFGAPTLPHTEQAFDERRELPGPESAPDHEPGPQLLTCLPGPVALFELDGELLVADLRRVRATLVRRRLLRELAAIAPDGQAPAQVLLQPIVVPRPLEQRQRLLAAAEALARLGLELEGFGDDAVLVRAVPAVLPKLLDARGIGALLDRLTPYLELRDQSVDQTGFAEAIASVSAATVDQSPRLARRWIAELLREHDGRIERVPGIRRWTAAALLGEER